MENDMVVVKIFQLTITYFNFREVYHTVEKEFTVFPGKVEIESFIKESEKGYINKSRKEITVTEQYKITL